MFEEFSVRFEPVYPFQGFKKTYMTVFVKTKFSLS